MKVIVLFVFAAVALLPIIPCTGAANEDVGAKLRNEEVETELRKNGIPGITNIEVYHRKNGKTSDISFFGDMPEGAIIGYVLTQTNGHFLRRQNILKTGEFMGYIYKVVLHRSIKRLVAELSENSLPGVTNLEIVDSPTALKNILFTGNWNGVLVGGYIFTKSNGDLDADVKVLKSGEFMGFTYILFPYKYSMQDVKKALSKDRRIPGVVENVVIINPDVKTNPMMIAGTLEGTQELINGFIFPGPVESDWLGNVRVLREGEFMGYIYKIIRLPDNRQVPGSGRH